MKDQTHGSSQPGFHRRDFLRGSGAAAAATALANAPGLIRADDQASDGVARGKQSLTLDVNGKQHKVDVEPRMTLLEVLRYQLQLTGAKPVSVDGCCGAATVLIDGRPVSATTTLAIECAGKKIQTVEGIGKETPAAFVQADAQQCGFCTPGFVVAVKAYLAKNPQASEDDIRKNLNGNICRCGTYYDVIDAAVALVKGGSN